MTGGFRELVAGSGAWQFPTLALCIEGTPNADAEALSRALTLDLARQLPPEPAIAAVLAAGALETAERMLAGLEASDSIDAATLDRLRYTLNNHERRAAEALMRRQRAIVAWCHRAGLERPTALEELSEYLISGPVLEGEIATLETQLRHQEAAKRDEIFDLLAASPFTDDEPRSAEVRQLADMGELVLARRALDRDQHTANVQVLPLRAKPWPLGQESLSTLIDWLDRPDARPAAAATFVPADDDAPGRALVDALREVDAAQPGALAAFARAVNGLVSDETARVTVQDGSTSLDLILGSDYRFPSLLFAQDRSPLSFSVGASPGQHPFRLSPQVSDKSSSMETVVDIAALLPLLAPVEGKARSSRDRRALLLRSLCQHLSADGLSGVVDGGSFAADNETDLRQRTWWFFHLLGFAVDGPFIDAFLYLTGGQGGVIVALAELELQAARAEPGGGLSVVRLRESAALAPSVLTSLQQQLSDSNAYIVLLARALGNASTAAVEDQLSERLLERDIMFLPRYIVDLPGAERTLVGHRLLTDDANGVRMAPFGALMMVDHEVLDSELDLTLGVLVAEFLERRDAIAAEREQADIDRDVAHSMNSFVGTSMRGSAPDLADALKCCRGALNTAKSIHPGVFTSLVNLPEGVDVNVKSTRLWSVLLNLLNNAAQSAERPTVHFLAHLEDGELLVTVEDNGDGFSPEILLALDEGDLPKSSKHPGEGRGLLMAVETARATGGEFRIHTDRSELGGAVVSMRIPVLKAD